MLLEIGALFSEIGASNFLKKQKRPAKPQGFQLAETISYRSQRRQRLGEPYSSRHIKMYFCLIVDRKRQLLEKMQRFCHRDNAGWYSA